MKKKTIMSKVLAYVLAMSMIAPMIPVIDVSAGDPGLVGTKSIVYNKGTLYNYSDSYHKGDTLYDINMIEGKGDFNADLRTKAYALNPEAAEWEGIYFGSGSKSTETITANTKVAKNLAKEFVAKEYSSPEGEFKVGKDGLWNGDIETKAWSTWKSNSGNGDSGYIKITSDSAQSVNQIKLYFLDNENINNVASEFASSITVQYKTSTNTDDEGYITMTGTETSETSADNTSRTVTIKLDQTYTDVHNIKFTFGHPTVSNYIILTEIELFDGVTTEETEKEVTKSIADYNVWAGNELWSEMREKRAYIYSGLAKETLVNGQIQFNVPDGGLFTSDTSNKEVYTNVGIPFVYDMDSGYYEFNAGPQEYGGYGVHFDWDYDGIITEEEQKSGSNLIIDGNHFYANDLLNGNQDVQGFFPFNSPQQITKEEDSDTYGELANAAIYHFGMNVSVDFSMTADGTINGKGGAPVAFEFSGDDDVWVFIDGQLVLDLGGIHDSVSAKIDFKENAITMWSTDEEYGSGDLNSASGITGSTDAGYITNLGQILNSENGTGKIAKSYDAFANEGIHTLTIYYLERGRGESNCKIRYNLPRVDTLDVTKHIQLAKGETEAITSEEWDALNAIDFTMRVCGADNDPVIGTYALYNSTVYVGTYETDDNGYFTLKNNQTAKFTTPLDMNYTIEELATEMALPSAVWKSADWTGTFSSVIDDGVGGGISTQLTSKTSANDATDNTTVMTYPVSIMAYPDAIDTLSVNCTNYISRPFVSVVGEKVVIDYGLPVVIDIMANDIQSSGKEFLISNITTPSYGKIRVLDADGNVVEDYSETEGYYYLEYTPTTYLSDMEKITYTYQVVDSNFSGGYAYPMGVATVIPATSMYYEENFLNADGTNYIRFSTAQGFTGFTATGTSENVNQEPGIVGTLDDSTYGTDAAYLNDTGDSNGTSYKADTENGPAAFQYTFTGTGTSFFARTSAKSGYLRISMKNSAGEEMLETDESKYLYIDTKYAVDGKTLYNIPVFNEEGYPYDTYTVTVTIAKPSLWYDEQNEFYLDGVRVYNPIDLSEESEYADFEEVYSAYETDLEADVQINTIRNYMLDTQAVENEDGVKEWRAEDQIMFTDSNHKIVLASEYESDGPKQELYMTSNQSIRFVLSNWFDDKPVNARLYLGAKVPEGSTGKFSVNGKEYIVNNTTDCYYDITSAITAVTESVNGLAVIEVTEGLVSLTNLKCTGFVNFSLAGMDEIVEGAVGGQSVYSLLTNSFNDFVYPEITVPVINRIAGADRYATSLKAADELKEEQGIEEFETVILADGRNFPDALSGTYLAGKLQAPILMANEKLQYAEPLREYIKNNLKEDGTIYVLGGVNAVPESVLNGLDEFKVKRLAGATRYETNLKILEEAGVSGEDILVCTGKGFADSLSAAATGKAILLVGEKLNTQQQNFIKEHAGNDYYIIGGVEAVNASVEDTVKVYGPVERISGSDRYETSIFIAEKFFDSSETAFVAYGGNFSDGLCGGPLAISKNAPLILVSAGKAENASAYVKEQEIKMGTVLGGSKWILDELIESVFGTSLI